MATIRVKLRVSTVPGKAGSIYYQVIHRRQHVQLTSSIKLYSHEWDTQNARVRINGEKVSFLLAAQRTINADLAVLHDIISRKEYEQWLRQRKIKRNSSSFYMRILRAVYNSAVSDGLAPAGNPFRKVYTGIDTTRKRAVGKQIIKQLKKLDLTEIPVLTYARDLFLVSLYLRGMAFVDMAYLQKSDIQYGVATYIRRKTGIRLSIKMEPCLQEIIDRYQEKTIHTPYVLPIITSPDEKQAYREYQNGLSYYNKQLKRLSEMLGYNIPLSSYTPRHTWATTARDNNIPLSVISAGMGHSSENITRIYLSSLDNSVIDKANHKIISVFN